MSAYLDLAKDQMDSISASLPNATESINEVVAVQPYRDVNDVRLLLKLASSQILVVILLLISLAGNIWMYHRRPDRIVVDRTASGDYVILASNGAVAGPVSIGQDQPGDGDKKALANKWCEARYAIDPLTRTKDIERLFKMMEPRAAKGLSDLMKQNGELERERDENWQAIWKPQSISIDRDDPYRVDVIGVQEITRRAGGVTQSQNRQLIFKLKLIVDKEKRRDERNQNTGFLVFDLLDFKDMSLASTTPGSSLSNQASVNNP